MFQFRKHVSDTSVSFNSPRMLVINFIFSYKFVNILELTMDTEVSETFFLNSNIVSCF